MLGERGRNYTDGSKAVQVRTPYNYNLPEMERKTIEEKVADTILQKAGEITIGERTYEIAPPTTATLILASEAVSRMPKTVLDPQKVVEESLSIAKDCKALGEVAAIMILGARNLTEVKKVREKREKRYLWGLFKRYKWVEEERIIDRKAELAQELLYTYSPKTLNMIVGALLHKMEIGDFFGLTTFLIEINLLRPTKVETGATASGA